jgi:uncharacterized protein DUF1549
LTVFMALRRLFIGGLCLVCSVTFAAEVESIAPLGKYTAAERRHWAFQERSHPEIPKFADNTDQTWAATRLDAFVLARLKKDGLTPSPPVDGATLIRRIYFDMTGLPPSPAETAEYE